jgi:2-dehydro-3-deoxyphosphogalactonate aldolase
MVEQQEPSPRPRIIAILRGIRPVEAIEVGQTLYDNGIRVLEVPLNSPDPLASIERLRGHLPSDATVGAGTVLSVQQVRDAAKVGSQVIVSPNADRAVIAATLDAGMFSYPGAATPTEAFTAVAAGAHTIKIFPAEQVGIAGMKAWASVVPAAVSFYPVGGITASNAPAWLQAGAAGLGVGSWLYRPGTSPSTLADRASAMVRAAAFS